MSEDDLVCRRCDRPVRSNRDYYETFERMHYVCFHYEFEHDMSDADPDEDCGVAGCPSAGVARHRDRLVATVRELLLDWSDGPPATWQNHSLPHYLEALAAWLHDSDGYYANLGVPVPRNGWEVIADALRAAAVYE
ncbi:DUF7660 family protein [Saccharothrix variisporea]|uniref:DUF7660 domain-containing protein n=1 Tax=Saccharothrix variisporea TaxID=543527 RepID=A0A495X3N7_9PSEU|nr:hypothetical protein [Saccharothrix variisporea]RKT67784.1 hypothetical protein DFJ66_0960 [Saccharothrix variisporea]